MQVRKTARYYVIKPGSETTAYLYAIHGYRQLGKYFIRHFNELRDMGVQVIVPEGLHRFYIEGYSGKVGASWMSTEDRLTDIDDYVAYLNQLHDSLQLPADKPVIVLGFSQGGPTACRWLASADFTAKALILHSTVFPNDFDFSANREKLKQTSTHALFGNADEFADEQTIHKKMLWMQSKGVDAQLLRFKGGHQIHIATLKTLLADIIK